MDNYIEEYDTIYCYHNSNVLINNFDIKDNQRLKQIERVLSAARLVELYKTPIKGNFDLKHLKKIHYHIFQDLYPWAGQLRTVNISKGSLFCQACFIEKEANKIFDKLKVDNYLKNLNFESLINKSAYYFAEINALHPFRDGNGRAQREFLRELLLNAGFSVNYTKFTPKMMIDASIASFNGDNSYLIRLFSHCISKI